MATMSFSTLLRAFLSAIHSTSVNHDWMNHHWQNCESLLDEAELLKFLLIFFFHMNSGQLISLIINSWVNNSHRCDLEAAPTTSEPGA